MSRSSSRPRPPAKPLAGPFALLSSITHSVVLAVPLGCAAGQPMPEIAARVNATLDAHPERLAPGDSLLLRFPHDPELEQEVRVDPAGRVSFLLIGSKVVAGKSPAEVELELREAYAPMLASPNLSVNLLGPEVGSDDPVTSRTFQVLGEVDEPGAFLVTGEKVTLIQGLARAGGLDKTSAKLKNVLLVRWLPDQARWNSWWIDAREDYWDSPEQILLQASDLVYVPNTAIDRVNIWVDKYIRQMIPFPYLIPPVQ